MAIFEISGKRPSIGKNVYFAPNSYIGGDITIGDDSSFWFGVVARGDVDRIIIGKQSNIQDLSMLHTSDGFPLSIGNCVSIGHKVTLHGCEIADNCLIGIGAIILDGVKVGKNSLVAAGSILPPGREYPEKSLIMGSPAKVVKKLNDKEISLYGEHYRKYLKSKDEYLNNYLEI